MRNQVNNSQSTAAVNSAMNSNVINSNNYFSIVKRVDGSYRSVPTTDCQNLWDNIFEILRMKGNESIITVNRDDFYMSVNIGRNALGTYSLYGRFSNGTGDYNRVQVVTDVKVWRGKNINLIAHAILEYIEESYNEYIKAEEVNNDDEISMAPSLEEAPMLEQDDITEDGYSIMGLNYLRENMVDADMEDIVDEAYEEVSNDLYVWLNELFRSGECPKDEFMDTMWAYAWDIIRDRGLSDEALEAETRYYVEFNDIVERRLEEWGSI